MVIGYIEIGNCISMKSYSIQPWLGLIFLVGISHAASGQCTGIALLDSSFESGVFDVDGHNGWFRSDGGSFEQGGYHGMLSTCSNAGSLWQIVPVQAQTTYYLSCYVKNTWSDPYRLFAGGTEYIDSTVASNWTFVSMPFTTGQDTSLLLGYSTEGSVCFDFMRVTCDPLSSIKNAIPRLAFQLFPNPASDQITIDLNSPAPEATATLTNFLGQVLRFQYLGGSTQATWDISQLPEGIYWLRVQAGKQQGTIKWIKDN